MILYSTSARSLDAFEFFEAELTTAHPACIPSALALRRRDTGAFIAMRDLFAEASRTFDILEASSIERAQLWQFSVLLL